MKFFIDPQILHVFKDTRSAKNWHGATYGDSHFFIEAVLVFDDIKPPLCSKAMNFLQFKFTPNIKKLQAIYYYTFLMLLQGRNSL